MKHEFGVTIATGLEIQEINTTDFPHTAVLDLRCGRNGMANPIQENVLLKLRNLHVRYEQMPLNMDTISSRQENELFRTLMDGKGNTLIIADQADEITRFCNGLDIPVRFQRLHLVKVITRDLPLIQPTNSNKESRVRSAVG